MPIRNQQVVEDGTQYVPPPHAYPDPSTARRSLGHSPVRQRPLHDGKIQSVAVQGTQMAQNVLGKLRSRISDIAQERAEKAKQRAQERTERELEQAQEYHKQDNWHQQVSQATTQPRHAQPRTIRQSNLSWRQQIYVYTVLLLGGYTVWALDGAFTVVGATTTILSVTFAGVAFATAGHFFLSWGQHTLIFHPHLAIRLLGLVLLAVNAGCNIYGINGAVRLLRPELLGALPNSPENWVVELFTWLTALTVKTAGQQAAVQPPTWRYTAIIIVVAAVALAWYAEKIRDYLYNEWKLVWEQRPL